MSTRTRPFLLGIAAGAILGIVGTLLARPYFLSAAERSDLFLTGEIQPEKHWIAKNPPIIGTLKPGTKYEITMWKGDLAYVRLFTIIPGPVLRSVSEPLAALQHSSAPARPQPQ